jgi:hypothetical protein
VTQFAKPDGPSSVSSVNSGNARQGNSERLGALYDARAHRGVSGLQLTHGVMQPVILCTMAETGQDGRVARLAPAIRNASGNARRLLPAGELPQARQ